MSLVCANFVPYLKLGLDNETETTEIDSTIRNTCQQMKSKRVYMCVCVFGWQMRLVMGKTGRILVAVTHCHSQKEIFC